MEDPRVRLICQTDVVLGQQTRQPRGQWGPVYPALTGATLIHWRHEDKIARNKLQLILVLRRVGIHHPQRLQGHDKHWLSHRLLDQVIMCQKVWMLLAKSHCDLETCIVRTNISNLVVCKANVPGEEDSQPITAQLGFNALGQFLQRRQVIGREVVGQSYMELLLMRLHMDF